MSAVKFSKIKILCKSLTIPRPMIRGGASCAPSRNERPRVTMTDDFSERLRRASRGAEPWTDKLVKELWTEIGWKFWNFEKHYSPNYVHSAEDGNQIARTAAAAAVRAYFQLPAS